MTTALRGIFLLIASLIVFSSGVALGAPADFTGVWETQSGWADEYFGWGGVNYTGCSIIADLSANEEYFSIKSVVVKCATSTGQVLKQFMPRQDFRLDSQGNLNGPTGLGRITGDVLRLELPDAYDGTHFVRFEIRGGTLQFGWSYEGEQGSAFEISGGSKGLSRTD